MAQNCLAAGCIEAMRVSLLDACGNPIDGAGNGYVLDNIVDLSWTREEEEDEETLVKKHCGAPCISIPGCVSTKWYNLEISLCRPDYEFQNLIEGNVALVETGPPVETIGSIDQTHTACNPYVFLEVWERTIGECTGTTLYRRHVWPQIRLRVGGGDEREGKARLLTLTGRTEAKAFTGIADGPFNDFPADVDAAFSGDLAGRTTHYADFYDTVLPVAACGAVAVPVQ